MNRIDTDVLVAGGGVAGLTAAAAFAARGFETVCVDAEIPVTQAAHAAADLRSTAFLQPAKDLLSRTGLWARLAPHAAPLRVMRMADAGGRENVIRETADFEAREIGADVFGWNLPNWLLRREMVAHLETLPRACLIAPARITRVTARTAGVIASLSTGQSVRARLLIGADGRESFVRETAGIAAQRWGYGQKALVFAVTHGRPHDGISTEIHRTGGPFTLVPLLDRDGMHASAVVWMDRGARALELAQMEEPEFERALNLRSCDVLGPLTLASPRRIWPIVTQVASRLDGARTALIAEAAHVIPPIGAQGLNMSLRDIATLLELCGAARDAGADIGAPALLARYNRARHPDILARVAGVDLLNRAAMTGVQALRDLRVTGLRGLHRAGAVRRSAMRLGLGAAQASDDRS